ncbi:AzlC family ABC transporter permease [Paraburkholderia azotifigens]|uniref:AzlC family ABC transporter permease n=1 Tax=Paraburkholderia azotifigens TaxID=2057004 RepID=A0A5C6VBH4_9BURK|nr:AzlC family ABC transporter permease [Paraburkholderia azotifigens]TXC80558.1 AzlC family ABC transporter permease [Paraburkholderia azotifigens]
MKSTIFRVLPVGLALAPVGFLFGVLAAQAHWSTTGVLLLSSIGFTGSGQFAYLALSQQGIASTGIFAVFLVILSMNLRYIPMSLSASQPLKLSVPWKFVLAHCLADESYATERGSDSIRSRVIIRIGIFLFWVASTVAGCALAAWLPDSLSRTLSGLTFPVSAILFALSFGNVMQYVLNGTRSGGGAGIRPLGVLFACVLTSVSLVFLLGAKYFWIPSILSCYLILTKYGKQGFDE